MRLVLVNTKSLWNKCRLVRYAGFYNPAYALFSTYRDLFAVGGDLIVVDVHLTLTLVEHDDLTQSITVYLPNPFNQSLITIQIGHKVVNDRIAFAKVYLEDRPQSSPSSL